MKRMPTQHSNWLHEFPGCIRIVAQCDDVVAVRVCSDARFYETLAAVRFEALEMWVRKQVERSNEFFDLEATG